MTALEQAKEALELLTGDAEHDSYIIAAAIKMEREACAKVALAHPDAVHWVDDVAGRMVNAQIKSNIAAAIRAQA